MALDADSLVLAHLHKQASHYHYNRSDVSRKTRRDRTRETEEAKTLGFYTYTVFKLIPIDKIIPQAVWREAKAEQVRKDMDRGKALNPIEVSEHGGRYAISDGIHRYNVSKERNFTHVPAYLTVSVEAPELYEKPEPEKKVLPVGTYVKLREPIDGFSWAIIDEHLGPRIWKGVRRQVYGLFGATASKSDFIGDIMDDKFDPAMPSPSVKKQLDAARW